MFTNFEYITFFSCPTERNIFYKRFISIKPLWLEIIEKKGCTKSVRVIYIIYIIVLGRTDFVHPFLSIISSQSGFIEMDLLQKMFFLWGTKKMVYIQNWWTIPLRGAKPLLPVLLWKKRVWNWIEKVRSYLHQIDNPYSQPVCLFIILSS